MCKEEDKIWRASSSYFHNKIQELARKVEDLEHQQIVDQRTIAYQRELIETKDRYIQFLLQEQTAYQELKARLGNERSMLPPRLDVEVGESKDVG